MTNDNWAHYRLEAFGEPYMVWHDGADFTEFRSRVLKDRSIEFVTRLRARRPS